jgi:SNF2 family DNA or RNA helicase
MSGTPAPKSPADWWNICEIACPGFLREGDLFKFKRRLAHVENVDSVTGGTYPRLVAWKDSEDRCGQCGLMRDDPRHDISVPGFHMWVQGKNEVANLYKRMSGLVMVKLKKDCLDLPEKRYKIIRLKPSPSTLSAAKLIVARSPRAITALTLLRELSDGFQYRDEEVGVETCSNCKGAGVVDECFFEDRPDEYPTQEELVAGLRFTYDENGIPIGSEPFRVGKRKIDCYWCSGTGQQAKVARGVEEVPCPKEDALKSILEDHEEHGRLVVYAGFTGSVDRCCSIARRQQWEVVRVDGRGWHSSVPGLARASDMLRTFQGGHEDHPRLVFVGQPSSAGMGLTLTASPTICYYSNDFNGESRIQSEDRIHRIGMDKNRGATIIDLIHLDTDQLILDNVKLKRKLQDMTMGELTGAFYAGDH